MTFRLTAAVSERPIQTIHAAELFHDNARHIAAACSEAAEGDVVVAAVSHDQAFRGVWTIPSNDLKDRVLALDDGGWSLVFSPGTSIGEVEDRALRIARLAFRRWEVMRRWVSRTT